MSDESIFTGVAVTAAALVVGLIVAVSASFQEEPYPRPLEEAAPLADYYGCMTYKLGPKERPSRADYVEADSFCR
jgi:hypothetical protein